VTGTLGVLERADVVGLLSDLPSTLAWLEASGFYLSTRLPESVLARHRNRNGIGS
jgi:predicted nucleic acid-binding protein